MTRAAVLVALGLAMVGSALAISDDPPAEPRLFMQQPGGVVSPVAQVPFEGTLDDPSLTWVVLPMGEARVRFLVGASGLRDTNVLQPLLFESNDCSGLPLIGVPSEPDGVLDPLVLGATVYWPDGPARQRPVRSEGWLLNRPEECGDTLYPPNVCCRPARAGDARYSAPAGTIELGYLRLLTAP